MALYIDNNDNKMTFSEILFICALLVSFASLAFSFPEAAILLVSTADRDLWPVPIFESAIRGLPVVLRSLWNFPKWRTSQRTSLIDLHHDGHEGLNFGLESLGLGDISLKKKYKVLKLLVLEKKYVLAVLPAGYGSTIPSQLPSAEERSSAKNSTGLVISPFNALIRDQIVKIREGGLNVCVLKRERVTGYDDRDIVAVNVPVEMLYSKVEMLLNITCDLMFAHPEVVVDSKKVAVNCREPLLLNEKYKRSFWMKPFL